MHETRITEGIFNYLKEEEKLSGKRIKKIYVSLSKFGALTGEHFLRHFGLESVLADRKDLEVEVKEIPFGKELEITRIDYMEPHLK